MAAWIKVRLIRACKLRYPTHTHLKCLENSLWQLPFYSNFTLAMTNKNTIPLQTRWQFKLLFLKFAYIRLYVHSITSSSLWILLVVIHYSKIFPPSARWTCKEAGVQCFVRLLNTEFTNGQLVLDLLSELRHRIWEVELGMCSSNSIYFFTSNT